MTVDTVERNGASRSGELETRDALELPAVNSRLQQFAADGVAAMSIARSVARTTFVPTSYKTRGKGQNKTWLDAEEVAYNVTAAWLAGDEIGLKPMQALQAIHIIEGTPALSAQAMRALVQSHGHDIWVASQSSEVDGRNTIHATVRGQRKGSERVQEITWTWNRARQAGLTEKDNWQKDPLAMCIARSTSAVCRLIAADVLMGLAYSAEELGDELEGLSAEQAAAPAPRGRLQRQAPRQDSRSALPAGTEPQEPTTTPERGVEPVPPETPEEGGQPTRQETPEEPAPSVLDGTPELREALQLPDGNLCQAERADGARCTRADDHDGRHHFGRARGVAEPTPAGGPAVAEFKPTPEEAAAADEGGDADALFPEVSDEENERAWLEEQAARAAATRTERETERAQERGPAVQPNPPEVGGRPVEDTALPDDGEDDDPWKEFR